MERTGPEPGKIPHLKFVSRCILRRAGKRWTDTHDVLSHDAPWIVFVPCARRGSGSHS